MWGISKVLHIELICPANVEVLGPNIEAMPTPAWLHARKKHGREIIQFTCTRPLWNETTT